MGHKKTVHKHKTPAAVGTVPKPKRLDAVPRRVKIAAIAVVVLIILGAVSWLVYDGFFKKTDPLAGNIDWSHVPEQNQKMNAATELATKGDLNASKAAFDALINQQSKSSEKSDMLQAKGNVCATYKDYGCALQSYQEAIKLDGGSSAIYIQAGNFAFLLNQKSVANGYYQQAIDILKKDSSKESKATVTRLESIISGMGSQGAQGQ